MNFKGEISTSSQSRPPSPKITHFQKFINDTFWQDTDTPTVQTCGYILDLDIHTRLRRSDNVRPRYDYFTQPIIRTSRPRN